MGLFLFFFFFFFIFHHLILSFDNKSNFSLDAVNNRLQFVVII